MSELKILKQSDVMWGHWFTEYYLKSEADLEIRKLKRIRCLAMARIASDDFHLHNTFYAMGKQDFELRAMNRCEKHRAKWLKLADKFKE